jgi:hypothetical protein
MLSLKGVGTPASQPMLWVAVSSASSSTGFAALDVLQHGHLECTQRSESFRS